MNRILQKEIIKHIFTTLGINNSDPLKGLGLLEPLVSNKFLIDKKIAFETEDGKKIENNIWAASTKIENSQFKIIIADISEDIQEVALIVQMDSFIPCAMRLSLDDEDYGSMHISVNDTWVEAPTSFQAKMLVGVENLTEIFAQWDKLTDYATMYQTLINFLNYYEGI